MTADRTKYKVFTQLTAPTTTETTDVSSYSHATWQVKVASINTNVVIRFEASLDGTNWYNLDASSSDTTITANGTYGFQHSNLNATKTRVNFVSEAGGTDATIDITLLLGDEE